MEISSSRQKALLIVAIVMSLFGWSTGNVAVKIAVSYFPADALALLRFICCVVLMDGIALVKHTRLPQRKDVLMFIGLGLCGYSAYIIIFNIGLTTVSASVAAFIISTSPVFTAMWAVPLLKEKMGAAGWVATVLSGVGVAIITIGGQEVRSGVGVCYLLISVVMLSFYNTWLRRLTKRYTSFEITLYCMNAALLTLLPFFPRLLECLPGAPLSPLLATLWLGTVTSIGAFTAWAYVLQNASSINRVSNFMFFTPLLTAVFAHYLLDETLTVALWWGGACILGGMLVMNWHKKAPAISQGAVCQSSK